MLSNFACIVTGVIFVLVVAITTDAVLSTEQSTEQTASPRDTDNQNPSTVSSSVPMIIKEKEKQLYSTPRNFGALLTLSTVQSYLDTGSKGQSDQSEGKSDQSEHQRDPSRDGRVDNVTSGMPGQSRETLSPTNKRSSFGGAIERDKRDDIGDNIEDNIDDVEDVQEDTGGDITGDTEDILDNGEDIGDTVQNTGDTIEHLRANTENIGDSSDVEHGNRGTTPLVTDSTTGAILMRSDKEAKGGGTRKNIGTTIRNFTSRDNPTTVRDFMKNTEKTDKADLETTRWMGAPTEKVTVKKMPKSSEITTSPFVTLASEIQTSPFAADNLKTTENPLIKEIENKPDVNVDVDVNEFQTTTIAPISTSNGRDQTITAVTENSMENFQSSEMHHNVESRTTSPLPIDSSIDSSIHSITSSRDMTPASDISDSSTAVSSSVHTSPSLSTESSQSTSESTQTVSSTIDILDNDGTKISGHLVTSNTPVMSSIPGETTETLTKTSDEVVDVYPVPSEVVTTTSSLNQSSPVSEIQDSTTAISSALPAVGIDENAANDTNVFDKPSTSETVPSPETTTLSVTTASPSITTTPSSAATSALLTKSSSPAPAAVSNKGKTTPKADKEKLSTSPLLPTTTATTTNGVAVVGVVTVRPTSFITPRDDMSANEIGDGDNATLIEPVGKPNIDDERTTTMRAATTKTTTVKVTTTQTTTSATANAQAQGTMWITPPSTTTAVQDKTPPIIDSNIVVDEEDTDAVVTKKPVSVLPVFPATTKTTTTEQNTTKTTVSTTTKDFDKDDKTKVYEVSTKPSVPNVLPETTHPFYVTMIFKMTWAEFCPHVDELQNLLAKLMNKYFDKSITKSQIVLQIRSNCNTYKRRKRGISDRLHTYNVADQSQAFRTVDEKNSMDNHNTFNAKIWKLFDQRHTHSRPKATKLSRKTNKGVSLSIHRLLRRSSRRLYIEIFVQSKKGHYDWLLTQELAEALAAMMEEDAKGKFIEGTSFENKVVILLVFGS